MTSPIQTGKNPFIYPPQFDPNTLAAQTGMYVKPNPHHLAIKQLKIEIGRAEKEIVEYRTGIETAQKGIASDEEQIGMLERYLKGLTDAVELLEEFGADELEKERITEERNKKLAYEMQSQVNRSQVAQQYHAVNNLDGPHISIHLGEETYP